MMDHLWTGAIIFAWGWFASTVGVDHVTRLYDLHLRERPWISAGIDVIPTDATPLIRYDVRALTPVDGRWRAWLEVDGARRCFGSGVGSYSPATPPNAIWAWGDWLGVDCAVPEAPFRACVSYAVRSQSGAFGDFGPFCSETYTIGGTNG